MAEACFDGVELRRVPGVEDVLHLQFLVEFFGLIRLVRWQPIKVKGKLLVLELLAEPL